MKSVIGWWKSRAPCSYSTIAIWMGDILASFTYNDNAAWLQVTVMPAANTGLDVADVFYFGNAVGETGNDVGNTLVNVADVIAIRDNPRGPANPAGVDDPQYTSRGHIPRFFECLKTPA